MNTQRWTLDSDINDHLSDRVPPKDIIEKLIIEREPIEAAASRVGDPAPDFEAELMSEDGERTGKFVRLAELRAQPVALLFGSYTCPVYRGQIARFNEIYDELKDEYAFLTIYTREAHPEDGWQVGINHSQGVTFHQPKTADQRAEIARVCMSQHGIRMPMALDTMNDDIEKMYSGSPERLYVIDAEGRVQYRSGRGPFMMSMIEEWYSALKKQGDM